MASNNKAPKLHPYKYRTLHVTHESKSIMLYVPGELPTVVGEQRGEEEHLADYTCRLIQLVKEHDVRDVQDTVENAGPMHFRQYGAALIRGMYVKAE